MVGAVIAKGLSPFGMPIQEEPVGSAKPEGVSSTQVESEGSPADSLSVIVSDKSIPLTFTNDRSYPWTIGDGCLQNGNIGNPNSSSTLSFSYNCDKRTELSFDWACYEYYCHNLYLYVDGVLKSSTTNSSYSTPRYFIDRGSHVVTFKDSIGSDTYPHRDWSKIRNICVKSILPLETAVLTDKSKPLTFVNESVYPWTIEDGYIQNGNYNHPNSASKFSTTFTIDEPSKFSFQRRSGRYYDNKFHDGYYEYHNSAFYINGKLYSTDYNRTEFGTSCLVLTPGTYTVEWVDTMKNNAYDTYLSQIKNIELSSNWIGIELAKAGTLGVEVLYKVDVLNDVELLKVSGNLNCDDWTAIKNMKNLMGLDLSEAKFNSVPDYAFDGLGKLSYAVLPEGLTSIGQYVFKGTQILNIDIPNTVTSIGQYAFAGTRVRNVNFKEGSQLAYIGYKAFSECTSLEQFVMPNTVTALGTYGNRADDDCSTFYGCTNLEKLHFSDALSNLGYSVCSGCSKLKDVHLPQNVYSIRDYAFRETSSLRKIDFPASLKTIGYCAFYKCGLDSVRLPLTLSALGERVFRECQNLKYVELPSYMGEYDDNFTGCRSIQKIVSKSATPPAISDDPFSDGPSKSDVTLIVPSFAVANYKLDTYWYQFGDIQEMDADLDYWRIASALSLTNNRRMNGRPDIDLYYGGQFSVSGNAPMTIRNFDIFVSESNPGRLLNDCTSMTADSVTSHFFVDDNEWYFLTPLHDVDLAKVTHSKNASFVFRYYDGASRAANGTGSRWRNVDDGK